VPIEVMSRVDIDAALRALLGDLDRAHPDISVVWVSRADDLGAASRALASGLRPVVVLWEPRAVSREAAMELCLLAHGARSPIWIWCGYSAPSEQVPAWLLDAPLGASPVSLLEPADDRDLGSIVSSLAEERGTAGILLRSRRPLRVSSPTAGAAHRSGAILLDGHDACVVASGAQVGEALAAAMDLQTQAINVRVVRITSIQPLDEPLVRECGARPGPLLVAEPGGGEEATSPILASAVEACLGPPARVVRVSPRPKPPAADTAAGAADALLDEDEPDSGPCARDIRVAVTRHVRAQLRERGQDGQRV